MRRVLMFGCIGILVIGVALIAVVVVVAGRTEPAQSTAAKPAASAAPSTVGQRVESAGIALTVNTVSRADTLGAILKAKPERTYVVTDVSLENATREKAPYNPVYFKVRDGQGYEYAAQLAGPDAYLKSGELAAGEMVRGTVAFDVPAGAAGLVLSYQPVVLLGGYQVLRVALN